MMLLTLAQAAEMNGVHPLLKEAAAFLADAHKRENGRYPLSEGAYATIKDSATHADEPIGFEAHRKYVDVHFLIAGKEHMVWSDIHGLREARAYSPLNDILFYCGGSGVEYDLIPGVMCVFMPSDGHKPNLAINEPAPLRKVVIKLPVQNG